MPNFELTDSETRSILIDPLPEKAGRFLGNRTQVNPEIPVDGDCAEPWNGVTAGLGDTLKGLLIRTHDPHLDHLRKPRNTTQQQSAKISTRSDRRHGDTLDLVFQNWRQAVRDRGAGRKWR